MEENLRPRSFKGSWNEATKMQVQRERQRADDREVAAKWIERKTGCSVSYFSDEAFCGSFVDGKVFCEILNAIRPDTVHKILGKKYNPDGSVNMEHEEYRSDMNMARFIEGCKDCGIPDDRIPRKCDLEGLDEEGTSCVLLFLEALSMALECSAKASEQAALRRSWNFSNQGGDVVNDSQWHGCSRIDPSAKGLSATASVTRLMQHCTAILREKSSTESYSVSNAAHHKSILGAIEGKAPENMGPVLETVLGSLTQEYEKRLLGKEREISELKDALQESKKKLKEIQEENLAHSKPEASKTSADHCPLVGGNAREASEKLVEAKEAIQDLQKKLSGLQSDLLEKEEVKASLVQKIHECHVLLAEKATKYRSLLEENRSLYNQVQDLKGSIRVYCRVRPCHSESSNVLHVSVHPETSFAELRVSKDGKGDSAMHKVYTFDKVFTEECSQPSVYQDTASLIRSVLDGYNVCIFAYGQTGSGKTYTMQGPPEYQSHENRGVNYRALEDLFALAKEREDETKFEFKLQMLEIYNEQLRDLLNLTCNAKKLDIKSTQRGGCNVPDATQVQVQCPQDIIRIMEQGESNRRVEGTKMNSRSSRSHSIVTVVVNGINRVTGSCSHACLHLIDLAGSERVAKSEAQGDRLKEAQHINRSLSALADVMSALASKAQHVPYRNSKLTQLLQDSLGGQAKVLMFAHVSPEQESTGETISTLQFAQRVSTITLGQASKNVVGGPELTKMKEELARRSNQVENLQASLTEERSRSHAAANERKEMHQELEKLKKEVLELRRVQKETDQKRKVYSSSRQDTHREPMSGGRKKLTSFSNGQPTTRIQQLAHDKIRGTSPQTPRRQTKLSPVSCLESPPSCSSSQSTSESRIPRLVMNKMDA